MAPASFLHWFLEDTHAPELLLYIGGPGERRLFTDRPTSWVYPQLLQKNSLWDGWLFRNSTNPYTELESLLAYDPGAYVGVGGPQELIRRIGLPFVNNRTGPRREESGITPSRIDAALVGHPELGEARIAAYLQTIADLKEELQPSSLTSRPRVILMAASTRETRISLIYNNGHGEYDRVYLPRAGVVNAAIGAAAENVERVLAVDPDIILLLGTAELPRQFMRDQRWLGLKAVREKRVYIDPWNSTWGPGGLTFRPVELRWIAELAHPDRLQPKVRQLLRDRMFGEFGYRLSDRQIDLQLRVADNSASLGAERFTRDYQVVGKRGF